MKRIALLLVLLPLSANAQQVPATVKITGETFAALANHLATEPYKDVARLMRMLDTALGEQIAADKAEADKAAKPPKAD